MSQVLTSRRRNLALSLLVLLVACTNVVAIPLSDYHENLKRAIESLEPLAKVDDDESAEDVEYKLEASSKTIRSILPEHQTVEFEGDSYNVDNTWLHKSLDELAETANRSNKLTQILASLRALESRVADRQAPVQ